MFVKKYACLFLTVILVSSSYADWKTDANARIEQIRKRNAEITVLGSNGQPVSDVNVQIVQVGHRFKFGTCLNYSDTSGNTTYQNFVKDHFNYAVCENESKWPANEPSKDNETYTQADYIYNFCHTNGIHMRGHCLFWEQTSSVPSWVQSLGCSDMQTQVNERIDHGVAHFRNEFEQWDVDNEMLNNDFYGSCLGEQGRANMFIRAHGVDPNCLLFMNEYNGNSFGGFDETSYINRVINLQSLGATIHGIGIQAHISGGFGDSQAQQYWNSVLKPLGTLGLPIMATEFDSDTTSDSTRASDVENFYRIVYSDPNVIGIVMWGFMVGHTWRASGQWGLVSSSGVLNAAGQKYEDLMDEWTTEDANYTNASGITGFRGFHGTYEITLSKPGEPNTEIHTIELEPGTGTEEFVLNTGFYSGPPDVNAPTPNPMTWASVPAATGPYSITMTATTATDNSPPVRYYFECTNHGEANSTWQTSQTYVATGLNPSTLYTFRVKARDNSPAQNQTGWSGTQSATTDPPDTDPPTPNLMTWASVPTATGSTTITMTATTATDTTSPPVQYYFECTNDGSKSSGWQSSPTYLATGLTPLTQYSFRVKARDSAVPTLNETGWSNTLSATTPAPPTDVNIIGSWVTGTTHAVESGSNRALIFIAHEESTTGAPTLTSVTYGGQPMTKIIDYNAITSGGYGNYVAAFILKEPNIALASGSTFTPTWSATTSSVAYSSAFFVNINETNSIGATAGNGTISSTPNPITTTALATSEGDMAILGATCGQPGSYTLNNSFTEGNDQQAGGSTGITGVTGYKPATGAAETPSATYSGTVNRQVIIGFVLKAMPTCATVQAGGYGMPADLNKDCYVDSKDLKIMADHWLDTGCTSPDYCGGADFVPRDGTVNFLDFSDFASDWMRCNNPRDANCN
ncbi:MAG: endo-1,4-beta-xylanase [Sedimentisphaerales bacterium]